MKGFSGYLRFLLFIILCFVFQDINAQFSKTHYIPPIGTTGSGAASPQIQYLFYQLQFHIFVFASRR